MSYKYNPTRTKMVRIDFDINEFFEFSESIMTNTMKVDFMHLLSFIVIPFLVLTVVISTIALLIIHYGNLDILRRKKSILASTDSLLTELLFWNHEVDQMRNAVEEFKYTVPYQKKWCRKLIMNRILMMKQNFQLDTFTILNIYKLFDFEKTTYDLLRNKKWHKRSLGAYQLQFINDDSNNSQLDSLLQEKNVQVKSNALITLVTFSPERFCILADYEGTITKADEIKLIDIIYHSALTIPKNTKSLLASKNTSIVILGIKLLVLYKVKLSKQELNKLIRLSNFRVRKEAIEAVGKLNIKGANEILINQYQIEQHKNIKINILVSLKKIGNKKTVLFLKSILLKEKDTDIKFKIIESIINLNPLFFEDKIQSETFNDLEIQSMARHVNDPLLV